jgi:hypothetical protein
VQIQRPEGQVVSVHSLALCDDSIKSRSDASVQNRSQRFGPLRLCHRRCTPRADAGSPGGGVSRGPASNHIMSVVEEALGSGQGRALERERSVFRVRLGRPACPRTRDRSDANRDDHSADSPRADPSRTVNSTCRGNGAHLSNSRCAIRSSPASASVTRATVVLRFTRVSVRLHPEPELFNRARRPPSPRSCGTTIAERCRS